MPTTKRRIHAKGAYRHEEITLAEAAYPGELVEMTSSGTIQKHSTEGGDAEFLILGEDALQGRAVATAYSSADLATVLIPQKGTEVNAMIQDGQDISIGEKLMSMGDGTLGSLTDSASGITTPKIVAIAVEACDLTGSDSSNTLARVRVV